MEEVYQPDNEDSAWEEVPKMRIKPCVYITLGTVAWLLPLAAYDVQPELGAARSGPLLAFLTIQVVALLTYPAGVAGLLVAFPLFYFGIVTPTETLLILGLISLAAGYLQWFVVIPKLFGRTRS